MKRPRWVVSEWCGTVSPTAQNVRPGGAAAWASISAGAPATSHPPGLAGRTALKGGEGQSRRVDGPYDGPISRRCPEARCRPRASQSVCSPLWAWGRRGSLSSARREEKAGDTRFGGGWPHHSGSVSRRTSPARGPRPETGLQARVPAGGPGWPLGLGVTSCPYPPTGPAVRLVTPLPHPLERQFPGLGTKCVWMWKLPGVATAPQTLSDKGLALFCLWGPCSAFWGT